MTKIENLGGVKNLYPTSETDLSGYELIDVRRSEEFTGELAHIKNAKLVTLGPELQNFLMSADKSKKYLFICRSGGRSTQACLFAQSIGFTDVTNLAGGMIEWNELGLDVES